MPKLAIIDNSALRALYHLKQLPMLHLIYDEVRVPRAVEQEFLNPSDPIEEQARFTFLLSFYYDNETWFLPCNEYDQAVMQLLQKISNMHKGESEVLAQNASLGNLYQLIIDERTARKVAQKEPYRYDICGVLSILARLDLQFSCLDYKTSVAQLVTLFQARYSEEIIQEAYQIIEKELNS